MYYTGRVSSFECFSELLHTSTKANDPHDVPFQPSGRQKKRLKTLSKYEKDENETVLIGKAYRSYLKKDLGYLICQDHHSCIQMIQKSSMSDFDKYLRQLAEGGLKEGEKASNKLVRKNEEVRTQARGETLATSIVIDDASDHCENSPPTDASKRDKELDEITAKTGCWYK